ncbi:MAG: hypothetical protein AABY09_02035, partial [Nanoarchaeota archaeon]
MEAKYIFAEYFKVIPVPNIRKISYLNAYSHIEPKMLGQFIRDASSLMEAIRNARDSKAKGISGYNVNEILAGSGCDSIDNLIESFWSFVYDTLLDEPFEPEEDCMCMQEIIQAYNSDGNYLRLVGRFCQLPRCTAIVVGSGTPEDLKDFIETANPSDKDYAARTAEHEREHMLFSYDAAKAIGREDLRPYLGIEFPFEYELTYTPCCWDLDFVDEVAKGNITEKQFNIYRMVAGRDTSLLSPGDKEYLPIFRGDKRK